MVCLEALRVLKVLGIRPRRTIRLVAWSGEEMGLANNGAEVYANKHQYEKTIIAFESDEGTTKPYGFGFTGNVEAT
jgi:carboxypeptidase Q